MSLLTTLSSLSSFAHLITLVSILDPLRPPPSGVPGSSHPRAFLLPLQNLAGTPEPFPSRSAGAPKSDPFPCSAKPGFHFPTLWLRCGSATTDRSKNQIYPSNPYPFANTIGAVPRVPHRLGSFLPPSPFHSPAPRPPLSSPLAPLASLCSRLDALFWPQSSAYPRPTPSSGKL